MSGTKRTHRARMMSETLRRGARAGRLGSLFLLGLASVVAAEGGNRPIGNEGGNGGARVVYSNVETSTSYFRNASDVFVWDDLTLEGGGLLTGLTLIANNSRPTPQPGSLIEVAFRLLDNPNGGPIGTPLGTVTVDLRGSTYPLGDSVIDVDDLQSFRVILPRNASIAVGVHFHDPTLSMGVVTFNPPAVGSSSGDAWVGDDPTPIACEGIVGKPVPCSFGWALRAKPAARTVAVDILRKVVNPHANGVMAVAILSTQKTAGETMTFDALRVVPSSVRFGPDAASAIRHRAKDIDDDGDADLLLVFRTKETGIDCGDTHATLRGKTFAGRRLVGKDSIRTVCCHR